MTENPSKFTCLFGPVRLIPYWEGRFPNYAISRFSLASPRLFIYTAWTSGYFQFYISPEMDKLLRVK